MARAPLMPDTTRSFADELNNDLFATLKAISDASAAAYQEGQREERSRVLGIIKSEIEKLPDGGTRMEHLIRALHGIVDRVTL